MLELLRKKQKSVLIKFVFWAIIGTFVGTIFLVWGKGRDGEVEDNSLAFTANGTPVSTSDYQTVFRNLSQFYQNIYGNSYNAEMEKQLNLPQAAYDQLLRQVLLEQEGDRIGIDVSRQEVIDSIAKIPQFQVNGVFDRTTYVQILAYQRMNTEEFEARQKRALFAEKTEAQITDGVSVNDADIEAEFRKRNEKVNLSFVKLPPTLFEKRVDVTDAALEAFFAEHQEEFRIPEKVALRYLQFDPALYAQDITLDEPEIERYYKRHIDQYAIDEQIKAAHILIRIDQNADDKVRAEKRKLAEKVLEQARTGDDFAQLARKYSDDTGSATLGGELGYFKRGSMVPEFEKAAFALNPGDISELVETQFGLHIIKAEGYIEAGEKPLADVYDAVKTALRSEKAEAVAFEKAMDAYNMNRKTGDLDKAAADSNLTTIESGLFARNEAIPGLGDQPEIVAAAFALRDGELARPLRIGNSTLLFTLKERQPSSIPPLSAVKSQATDAYRKQGSSRLAEAAAATLLSGLKEGKTMAALARKEGLTVEETGLFARSYGAFVPRIGENEQLANAAFALTDAAPVAPEVYDLAGQFVVASLKERTEADMALLDDSKREELRTAVLEQKRQDALKTRIDKLRAEANIVPSATLLSQGVKP
jgi:peptidyl-prolyl cis-trans isomerase D